MYTISSCANSDICNNKISQELNNNIYLRAEHFLAAMEKQRDEGDSRILLDDNTGGAAIKLRQVGFRRVGVSVSTELNCIYTYSWPLVAIFNSKLHGIFQNVTTAKSEKVCKQNLNTTYRLTSTECRCLGTRGGGKCLKVKQRKWIKFWQKYIIRNFIIFGLHVTLGRMMIEWSAIDV
jgi:hypothetical protein